MNQLETNLILWAICSILLFEILCIICLFRCCFNRIKPKRFYVKREEYEYLQGNNSSTQTKFQSTIIRPPHADELALIGTIRVQNPAINYNNGAIENLSFYRENENEINSSIQSPLSQHWIELQPKIINTAQLPPANYEIHSYPTDDYLYTHPSSRSTIIDIRQHREDYIDDDNNNELTNFRFQSLRRPEIILPQPQRIDTSTESYGINYLTVVPKSILKGNTNTTPPPPPIDLQSTPYSQKQHNYTSSKYDESPRTSSSIKITTDQSIPIEPLLSKPRMRFASVNQLNDTQWEIPREFQAISYNLTDNNHSFHSNEHLNNYNELSNRQRTQSANVDQKTHISRVFIPWKHEMNSIQPNYFSKGDITQQQAFEY